MTDNITLIGFVATEPKHFVTREGLAITSFRLASTQRRFDRAQGRWSDGETNWYTISTFRQLAINAVTSVKKGDRLMVSGRLRIRGWEAGERSGINIEVEADAVGHDLAWGTAVFTRSVITPSATGGGQPRDPEGAAENAGAETESSGSDSQPSAADDESFPSASELDAESVAVPF